MSNENGKKKLTPVSELGEFGLIKHLTSKTVLRHASSIKGVGDDAAVLFHKDEVTLVSTDLLIENIHFDLIYTPMRHLGYKSVVVNLSDIYAMNGEPKQITVSLGLSSRFTVEALEEFYEGIHAACRVYNVDLVGGDTTSSNKGLIISITAIGTVDTDNIVYRSGAKVGDLICVSGDLGAAYLGLQLLEREKQIFLEDTKVTPDLEEQTHLVGRLLKPEARKDTIELLRKHRLLPTAMIDISDGLSSELFHICEQSQVGCRIYEENIPIHPDTHQMALRFKISPTTCALSGGEDYELLFTIDPKHRNDLEELATHGIRVIGNIVPKSEGKKLHTRENIYDLLAQGWKHLNRE